MVCRVKVKKNIAERIGLVTELDEDRGEQSASILLFLIPEVEKEVGHVCWSSVGGAFDILDDGGTGVQSITLVTLPNQVSWGGVRENTLS